MQVKSLSAQDTSEHKQEPHIGVAPAFFVGC